jgi:quercetin dioxygenase-like cupin family protein
MDHQEYFDSGIIDAYCMGFTSPEENEEVRAMAEKYPEVAAAIAQLKQVYESTFKMEEMKPSPSLKEAIMISVYAQQSESQVEFVPLLHKETCLDRLLQTVTANKIVPPTESFDNIFMQELPSTREVLNFAVWAKVEQEEETHTDIKEFIAVLEGSCDMYIDGVKGSYGKGDVIAIPLNAPHHAIITSPQPMFAFVQRQLVLS